MKFWFYTIFSYLTSGWEFSKGLPEVDGIFHFWGNFIYKYKRSACCFCSVFLLAFKPSCWDYYSWHSLDFSFRAHFGGKCHQFVFICKSFVIFLLWSFLLLYLLFFLNMCRFYSTVFWFLLQLKILLWFRHSFRGHFSS